MARQMCRHRFLPILGGLAECNGICDVEEV